LQKVFSYFLVFQKSRKKNKVVQIPDKKRKDHLDRDYPDHYFPFYLRATLMRDYLVEKERQVHAPEGKVQQHDTVPVNK
jgi:hypothetical protein